jgi:hypothetical protein
VEFDSFGVLERNPPGFQSDEHAFRGYRGAFLWAKGSTAYEDEHLNIVSVVYFEFYDGNYVRFA